MIWLTALAVALFAAGCATIAYHTGVEAGRRAERIARRLQARGAEAADWRCGTPALRWVRRPDDHD